MHFRWPGQETDLLFIPELVVKQGEHLFIQGPSGSGKTILQIAKRFVQVVDLSEEITAFEEVAWSIPISLGDSHRGFCVMGTNPDYFEHYQYGQSQHLAFSQGQPFADVYDAVIGADVARTLGYPLGGEIVIAHGLVSTEFSGHDDKPSL